MYTFKQIIMSQFTPIISVISECSERQLASKQDIAAVLTLEQDISIKEDGDQPVDVIAVMDGHGHNVSVEIIRQENLYEHFATSDPAESLQQALDIKIPIKKAQKDSIPYVSGTSYRDFTRNKITNSDINGSGATLSFAKIYRNTITKKIKIVAEWLGDSPILVFINGELVFQSEIHHASNVSETERLKEKGVLSHLEDSKFGFKVLGEKTIASNPGKYVLFNNNTPLAITRSLGHCRITGIETQKETIECSTDDEVKVVIFSDGVGDVLHLDTDIEKIKTYSADEIVDLAENRWKQEWDYNDKKTKFPSNGYDDCCCAIWCNKKM
jgi:serine/threonine protein phosphatase PrpC